MMISESGLLFWATL